MQHPASLTLKVTSGSQQTASMRYASGWNLAAGDFDMSDPFAIGTVVVVTLNIPREKFWGTLLALTPAGASLRGIDLNSVDDFARQVRDGDDVNANVVFFPMHRIERVELDLPDGNLPSLSQRFLTKTGREPSTLLTPQNPGRKEPKPPKSHAPQERA
jgi:hypothetical protein